MSTYYLLLTATIAIFAIEVVAMQVIAGWTGQLSLAQAAIMGVAAYGYAIATTHGQPVVVGMLIGLVLAVVLGLITVAPALRLRGDYFAIATLGLGQAVTIIETNWGYAGSVFGISSITPFVNTVAGLALVSVIVAVLVAVVAWLICRSIIGSVLLAIRADEAAARGVGIDVTKVKVAVFVFTSFLAALGGILYTQLAYYVAPDNFNFDATVLILIPFMLSGGRRFWLGVAMTAAVQILQQYLSGTPSVSGLVLGVLLLVGIALPSLSRRLKLAAPTQKRLAQFTGAHPWVLVSQGHNRGDA